MASSISDMSPQSIGGLVRQTFWLYGRHFWAFLALSLVCTVPSGLALSILQQQTERLFEQGEVTQDFLRLLLPFFILFITLVNIISNLAALSQMALIRAISQSYQEERASIGICYKVALGRLWTLMGAWGLVGLVFLGLLIVVALGISLIVVGVVLSGAGNGIPTITIVLSFGGLSVILSTILALIYFAVRWYFIPQTIVQEKAGVRRSMSRSSTLTRETWWLTFGVVLLFGIMSNLVYWVGASLVSLVLTGSSLALVIARGLLNGVALAIALPIFVLGTTRFYYDLRVRKEGYNLQAMAQELSRA